ncbi:MAG: DinB family protein [Flavobacteriales bacterium]|nr:DinB family protein [Flavobacteriales bacterium]
MSWPTIASVVEEIAIEEHPVLPGSRKPRTLVVHAQLQFDELHVLVERLGQMDYAAPVPILSDSSIGQHVRHILEFYICLMEATDGTLDYDARKRDKSLENERVIALGKLAQLRSWTGDLTSDEALVLIADHSYDGSSCERMGTSLFRELAYAFDHAIHHMALLRIAIAQQHPGITLDPNFGVAPSTIRDRNKCVR